MHNVAVALADDHPLALLELVSSLLAALDPRRRSPFEPEPNPDVPSREEIVQTFLDVDLPETSALLAVIAVFCGDEMLRRRAHREITERARPLPRWLADLRHAELAERVVEVVHVLGDGDNVMVGVRLPDGHELTAVVYIDHNMGTLVKDAFVVPAAVGDVVDLMLTAAGDPDTEARDLHPADARTRIIEAIKRGEITFPPCETDTWPACRPLIEWVATLLPGGGTGYQRPEWAADALAALTERFFGSSFGGGFDDDDHRGLLESLLWFGTDYGPGDPLRWSPVTVEILLVDWIPRKIVHEASFLAKAPGLLRAFIRFCHHERGIGADLTAQTLDAVDKYEPQYQRLIRSPRPQGPAALLAAMGVLHPDQPWGDDEPVEYHDLMLDILRRAVGGGAALDQLDTTPLPDEPFAWDAIPADIHDRVREVLELIDRGCAELLDAGDAGAVRIDPVEYRTACRRFLAAAAAGDPEIFRRRGRTTTAAAAVCWVIGKANSLFDTGGLRVKDLARQFDIGQSSVSQRSEPLLRAVGVSPQYGTMNLGSPDYLSSARRAQIIARRDNHRATPG
ncbi:MAG: DUF6398 domain-containing protein [Pseudonocardia sp.]